MMTRKPLVLLLAGILLALGLLAAPALAQGANLEPSVEVDFPSAITFRLRAEAPVEITRAVLRYELERITCFQEVVERQGTLTPGKRVEATWTWDMRKTGGLPAGATMKYSWTVTDAQGGKHQTEEKTFIFEDQRYSWRKIESERVTLFWYRGDEAFARRLLQASTTTLERLKKEVGAELERGVKLYIYESSEALRGARVFPQAWEGGVAFPDYGIMAIGIGPRELSWGEGAIAHELAHLVTYQMTYNCYSSIPVWLNEGLSMYAEGGLTPDYSSRLRQARERNTLISVKTLASPFPADPDGALLSYAQSFSLVDYLIKTYGREKMLAVLRAFKEGLGYDEALMKVYGFDMAGLDQAWRLSVGASPAPTPPPPPATPETTPTPVASPTPQPPVPPSTPLPTSPPSLARGLVSCKSGYSPGADLGSLLAGGLFLLLALIRRKNINGR